MDYKKQISDTVHAGCINMENLLKNIPQKTGNKNKQNNKPANHNGEAHFSS